VLELPLAATVLAMVLVLVAPLPPAPPLPLDPLPVDVEVVHLWWAQSAERLLKKRAYYHGPERTAETHVQNILNKLGFTSRAQVAARAVQHEFDHLDGVLMIDRTTPEARREALATLRPRVVIG